MTLSYGGSPMHRRSARRADRRGFSPAGALGPRLPTQAAGAAMIIVGLLASAPLSAGDPSPSIPTAPPSQQQFQPQAASSPQLQFQAQQPPQPQLQPQSPQQPLTRETREFEVIVKGTPRGVTNIRIEQYPGRRAVVTTSALIQVNLVVYTYTFEFNGTETWVDDRLVSFNSSGSDGGKKYTLSGVVRPGQSQVAVNNKALAGPEFALTTNYWRLPMLRVFNETIPIIDASTGAFQKTRINRGAEDKVTVGGVVIPCTVFRLTGDVDARIWLDRDGFIVRQESVESGYPTEMRLKRVVRDSALTATVR